MQLRPYQRYVVSAVESGWGEASKQLAVVPTGGGKTIIFASLAARNRGRTLILAHREELIGQAADKIQRATGITADVEKAERWADPTAKVVVASVQTLTGDRLNRWPSDHFSLVVCDEAHHAVSNSWQRTLARFDMHADVLGVTATSDRSDKKDLGVYFQRVAAEVRLVDLIRDGYLSPITIRSVPLKIDLSAVKSTAGDLDAGQLGSALDPYLDQIAQALKEHAPGRRTLAFLPLIATSQKFADACRRAGLRAEHVDGYDPERKSKLERFASWEWDVLSNAMLLTEGYDDPGIDCILNLRPTKSRPLYCLDSKTEVLTRSGWSSDVKSGTDVLAFNRGSGELRYEATTGSVRRRLNPEERFVSITGPSVDIRVTDKHNLIYDTKRKAGWKLIEAGSLARLTDTNYLPVSGRMTKPGVPLTDHELRFIGWVMTDGTIGRTNKQIAISQGEHQPWCKNIEECIVGCGFKFTRRTGLRQTGFNQTSNAALWTVSFGKPRGTDKHLAGWGRLEPWLSKDFSPALLDLTPAQFDVLIEAIHLGDGSKQAKTNGWTRRSFHICSANLVFIERLQVAAIESGYRANLSFHSTQNPIWMLHLKKQSWSRVGGTSGDRPSWKVEPFADEECWCVEVPSGAIVTRRNGKVSIVGNCQMIGRGTRVEPLKDDLLVLDFLWMHERHSLSRPAHLVASSDAEADAITELSQEKAEGGGDGQIDLLEAVSDAAEKREKKLADELRKQVGKRGKYITAEEFALRHHELAVAEYEPALPWEHKPPTERQAFALKRAGVDPASVRGRGHASKILDIHFKGQALTLASPAQRKLLARFGHPSPDVASVVDFRKFMAGVRS